MSYILFKECDLASAQATHPLGLDSGSSRGPFPQEPLGLEKAACPYQDMLAGGAVSWQAHVDDA